MTEKSHPLGRRGVAASRVAALELEWNIADTHPGGADQDLEQDLEPNRSELDALDCRSLAQEISRERVRGLAGFAEERLHEPSADGGRYPPGRPFGPPGAPAPGRPSTPR